MSNTTSAGALSTNAAMSTASSPAFGMPSSPASNSSTFPSPASSSTPGILPMSHAVQSVNIQSLISFKLDMLTHNYSKWKTLFILILGRFNLRSHVEDSEPRFTPCLFNVYSVTMGKNLTTPPYVLSLRHAALPFASPAPIHHHKRAKPNAPYALSTMSSVPFSSKPTCNQNIGPKLSPQPPISSTAGHANPSSSSHHIKPYFTSFQIIPTFEHSVAYATQTKLPPHHIN